MSDLKTNNTSYPTTIDTATAIADVTDTAVAQHVNGPNSAIVAIENELGVATATNCSLKGTCASLAARLAFNISAAGGVPSGTSFPTSPTPVNGQLFMRTDYTPERLYFYASSTASWVQYSALLSHGQLNNLLVDDHTQYVHNTIARTISANHEFSGTPVFSGSPSFTLNPTFSGTPSFSHATGVSPFTVTSTTKVTNLNAEQVDGYDASTTPVANQIPVINASGNLILSVSSTASTIKGTNTGTGTGVYGINTSTGIGVQGDSASTGYGVYGYNTSTGKGVYGYNSSTGKGVQGDSASTGTGVYGTNSGTGKGVQGDSASTGTGVYGTNSGTGFGVRGDSASTGFGVYGNNNGTGVGVYGTNNSTGVGVYGDNTSTGYGVRGDSVSTGVGVFGTNSGTGDGVKGESVGAATHGVMGTNSNTGQGVYGYNSSIGNGVKGESASGRGINGYGASNGGNTVWTNDSDRRLKNSIETVTNALDKVTKLRGVTFIWNKYPQNGRQMGFIAQEVEPIVPEVVSISKETGLYEIQQSPITAVLVEAVKELAAEVKELKREIAKLKKK